MRLGARTRDTYLSARFWRLVRRIGKKKAAVAVAHSIPVICRHLLTDDCDYDDLGGDYFTRRNTDRRRDRLIHRLHGLGYRVTLEKAAQAGRLLSIHFTAAPTCSPPSSAAGTAAAADGPTTAALAPLHPGDPEPVARLARRRAGARVAAFSRRGRAEGAGASLSVPLSVGDGTVGAINLYASVPHAFTPDDHERARRLAHRAAGAVGLAILLAHREERSRHLEIALTTRSLIDQALGVLMGQHGVPAAQAFDMLRRRSQQTNVKLRDVAAALVDEVVSGTGRRGTDASAR